MVCPYCHKEIPEDSVYCYHCGKELNKQQKQNSNNLKKNPHENSFAKLGLLLFFIALFGFDFVLGTIFNPLYDQHSIICWCNHMWNPIS